MATTIKLKMRKRTDSVVIPSSFILEWFQLPGEEAIKNRLYEFFKPFEDGDIYIHDKAFLETTVNWVPTDEQSGRPRGLPLTEQVRWIKLAQKINDIDAEKEGELILSNKDIDLIWERWNDGAFKLNSLPVAVAEFLMEFQEATNRWFPDLEPEESKGDK